MVYTFNSIYQPCICGDVNFKRLFNTAIEDIKMHAAENGPVFELCDIYFNEASKARYVAGLTVEIFRPLYADYNEVTICLSKPTAARPIIYKSAMHIKKSY